MPAGMDTPYTLSSSKRVNDAFRALYERACQLGLEEKFLSAARIIVDRLRSDPLEFGEARYRYRRVNAEVRIASIPPLVVHYAVHEQQRVVFMKEIGPFPGFGF
jgi:hypothetical protein